MTESFDACNRLRPVALDEAAATELPYALVVAELCVTTETDAVFSPFVNALCNPHAGVGFDGELDGGLVLGGGPLDGGLVDGELDGGVKFGVGLDGGAGGLKPGVLTFDTA